MLSLLSEYTILTQCYSDQTNLEINEVKSQIQVYLFPTGKDDCNELPSAVILQVTFQNPALDVQIVSTVFQYKNSIKFNIPIPNIALYFDVKASQLKLKSYNQVLVQQIQEITLTRSKDTNILYNLAVSYDQKIFTTTANFPKTFTTINVINAMLIITNSIKTYTIPYDGKSTVDSAAKTVVLMFENTDLSPILYDTGVLNIRLESEYGSADVFSSCYAKTNLLEYKNQPSPGNILEFTPYSNSLYIEINQSEYFVQELAKCTSLKIVITVNDGVCQLIGRLPAASMQFNIQVNTKFQANLDHNGFPDLEPPALSFVECMHVLEKNGQKAHISVSYYDAKNIAINRVYMDTKSIQQSCFENVHMNLEDSTITVTATRICPVVLKQRAQMILKTYSSQHTYFLEQSDDLLNIEFDLEGDLKVQFNSISNDIVEKIKDSYSFRLLILTKKGVFIDVLQPTFSTTTFEEIIIINIIILISTLSISVVIGGLNIFYKRKSKLSKRIKKTIEIDEI
ncbi:hypothetical protein SS50377_26381 [Spironucleus salmonicida]|uniref:Transmembrane protein n=1 Tax=Spironucleus salmonicida TaxID=348837 RepID=V6LSX8_9EUKA|nr:hypothetical protein SS50377_26381 [Spironucleus salmonicida]|eukprot:EST47752.1 Hypothetical protein SS50377_12151 [Spironucleus salmonicida]